MIMRAEVAVVRIIVVVIVVVGGDVGR